MKSTIAMIIAGFWLLANMGCTKETVYSYSNRPQNRNDSTNTRNDTTNTQQDITMTLHAHAGFDIMLELPLNETYLNGSFWWSGNQEYVIKTTNWVKVSGPASLAIENENALRTKVNSLEKGFYQFELTVITSTGITVKDTVAVIVGQLPTNPTETIFKNLEWVFPWYSSVAVKDFNLLISPGTFFKVYIQRDDNQEWKEVPASRPSPDYVNGPYEYFIEERPDGAGMYAFGSLYIFYYGYDVSDTPDVKIVF